MMKFRMRNENGEEFEFEGDEQAFRIVIGQLGSRLFGGSRRGTRGALQHPISAATVASRMGSKQGPELLLAAVAKLTLVDGKETFTRAEALKEMSSVTSLFTENHRKNLTKYIRKFVADRTIEERSDDEYHLNTETRQRLAAQLQGAPKPMRNSVLEYVDPFDPVASEDWGVRS